MLEKEGLENVQRSWELHVVFLRELAILKGISPSQIANAKGYSRSTIKRIFDLEFCPKHQIVLDIARALDIKLVPQGDDENIENAYNRAISLIQEDNSIN